MRIETRESEITEKNKPDKISLVKEHIKNYIFECEENRKNENINDIDYHDCGVIIESLKFVLNFIDKLNKED